MTSDLHLGLIACLFIVTACQNQELVKDTDIPDGGTQTEPAYSKLTRVETEETLRRLHKIRQSLQKNRPARYTGPIHHIWDRIRAGKQIEYEDNLRIERQATYLLRDKDYINRVSHRTTPLIYFILEEIDKRNLPAELALLPVIESAYRPTAVSRSRAVGLWQFIEPTRKFLGMKKNWWYDARRDAVVSTRKALDYLAMLNKKFDGDWLLTLAAYNAGHGRISQAIERNRRAGKPTDYWNLKLSPETRNYVPRFLAASRIYTQPEDYEVILHSVPNKPYFDSIKTDSQIDIRLAAEIAGMEYEEFRFLNAGFLRWSTPPKGSHRLLLPLDKLKQFKQGLAKLTNNKHMGRDSKYKIHAGDTLNSIANKYGVSVSMLKRTNQLQNSKIIAGSILLVPTGSTIHQPGRNHTGKNPTARYFYTVQSGDTLWNIAKQHRISIDQLLSMNKLNINSVIQPGQRLRIRTVKRQIVLNEVKT